jgi:hypothetical protein
MTQQRLYHCFVAGLPELRFDGSAVWISPTGFVEQLKRELHPDDFSMAGMLLLRYDHDNMIRFIRGKELTHQGVALFTENDFTQQKEIFDAIVPQEDILPPYMAETLRRCIAEENAPDTLECRRMLDSGYYNYIMLHGSRFAREYSTFEYNLSNMLSYIMASRQDSDPLSSIAGVNPFADHLRETGGRNLVKDPEFEYFDEILSVAETYSLADAEMRYDRLRWQVVEKITLFEDFSADAVLGYMMKLLIASRWDTLSEERGKEYLLETVDNALGEHLVAENETND